MSRGKWFRTVGAAAAGLVLLALALVIAFWRRPVGYALAELDPVWLQMTSWAGLNLVAWASLAGGAWLVAVAWQGWRGTPDDEPGTPHA